MTVVKSQSFCGGQNGLTILAKIIFKTVENIFDHLVRPFWPIFFVATMVNGRQLLITIGLVDNILTMQFFTGIFRNTQSKSNMLSLTEYVWYF